MIFLLQLKCSVQHFFSSVQNSELVIEENFALRSYLNCMNVLPARRAVC
jgi:hypothetical protein